MAEVNTHGRQIRQSSFSPPFVAIDGRYQTALAGTTSYSRFSGVFVCYWRCSDHYVSSLQNLCGFSREAQGWHIINLRLTTRNLYTSKTS